MKVIEGKACVALLLAMGSMWSCSSNKPLSSRYCFSGDVFSTGGHTYSLLSLSMFADSSFIFTEKVFDSGKDRRSDNFWRMEEFSGTFRIKSDTLFATVDKPADFYGKQFTFTIKKNKLMFLNYDKTPLQTWRKCSKKR